MSLGSPVTLPFALNLGKLARNIHQESKLVAAQDESSSQDHCNINTTTTTSPKSATMSSSTTMDPPEHAARQAGLAVLQYWCGGGAPPPAVHPECLVTLLLNQKAAYGQPGKTRSCAGRDLEIPSGGQYAKTIVATKLAYFGAQTAAVCQFQLTPHQPTGGDNVPNADDRLYFGFLTLLKSNGPSSSYWTCISAALDECSSLQKNLVRQVLPSHVQAVTQLTWNGYCTANRACDGVAMARVFHPNCRLTYVGPPPNATIPNQNNTDDGICIISQPAFCDKVQQRYANEPHAPYSLLQMHGDVGQYDRIDAIEFATPNVCLVTLRVGHPPCLWHDVLTCCNLGGWNHHYHMNGNDSNNNNGGNPDLRDIAGMVGSRDTTAGWWIMHKSSCMEEYQLTYEMKQILQLVDHVAKQQQQQQQQQQSSTIGGAVLPTGLEEDVGVDVDVYDT